VASESVAIRERTGVLPDGFGPLGEMTGRQHVEFAVEAKGGTDDPLALIERTGVAHAADRPVSGYSKGMAQRLMLSMALAGDPDLLILDEPTTGLDPNGAREMREIVREERDRGATVFFSSHILEQVEAVADRVGILDQGNLVAVDTLEGLREAVGETDRMEVDCESVPDALVRQIEAIDGVRDVAVEESALNVACESLAKGPVVHRCVEATTVTDVETSEASLEDLFAAYTEGLVTAQSDGRAEGPAASAGGQV
jgi:ABC-2 type transport system ATP-binding protein